MKGLKVEVEKELPIYYKDIKLDNGYRIDIFVEQAIIIELKSVQVLNKVHLAQMLTYIKLSSTKVRLLINFNEKLLKNGLKRVIL